MALSFFCVNTAFADEITGEAWRAFYHPRFDQITTADGLPNDILTALAEDADGGLWIGSFNGLAHYDGQRIYRFEPEPGQSDALPDGYVRCLLALPDGRLLVGTNNAGLAMFDPRTQLFSRVPLGDNGSHASTKIFSLRPARDGGVWVASENGLNHFDPDSGTTRSLLPEQFQFAHSPRIFDALEDDRGALWVGGNPGLFVRESGEARFRQVVLGDALDEDIVWRLHQSRDGRLWVGTGSHGLTVLDADGRADPPPLLVGADGLTGGRTVRAFAEMDDGQLWIGTEGRGVIVCNDLRCGKPQLLRMDGTSTLSLAGDSVRDLYLDASGVLWLATSRGLSRHMPPSGPVLALSSSERFAPAFRNSNVTVILKDSRQRIWLGSDGAGLEVIDLATASSRHVEPPGVHAEQLILGLAEDSNGTIRAGSLGVLDIDPDSLAVTTSLVSLPTPRVSHLASFNNELLVSTYDGTHVFDVASSEPTAAGRDGGDARLKQVRWTARTDNARWYATINGLFVRSDGQPDLEAERHRPNDATSLPTNYLSMLAWDRVRKRLWIVSEGGLVWLDLTDTSKPRVFRTIDNKVTRRRMAAVTLDSEGNVWASGNERLVRVDAESFEVRELTRRDGLHPGVFHDRAMAVGPSGEILIGGTAGLVVVYPEKVAGIEPLRRPLGISRVWVNGKYRPEAATASVIDLARDERQIDVDFSLRDFRAPNEIHYSYRLNGFDANWQDVPPGTPASAKYTNLGTGEYVLQLRARVDGLDAQDVIRKVTLRVAPMRHETVAARVLQALAAMLVTMGLVIIGLRWSHRRQKLLDRMVAERTRELDDANAKLEQLARTDPLTGLNTRRYLMDVVGRAMQEARQHGRPLSLLLMDLDHFKSVNDHHGHLAGDATLKAVSDAIRNICTGNELTGRYGGEEFLICLPNTGLDNARALAERLRREVADTTIQFGESSLAITCSIGIAVFSESDETIDQFFARADLVLYEAKRAGRNRVRVTA